jgi:hypothetical protein
MMTRKRLPAVVAGALVLGGLLALGGAQAATADSGSNLRPGSTVCTARIASATGVAIRGSVTRNTASAMWTVRVASTATGTDSEFFRTATGPVTFELKTTNVVPPVTGTFYFRACMIQLGPLSTNYTLFLDPRPAA